MSDQTLPNIDVLDSAFVEQATTAPGPWVSIFVPTHRTGRETMAARTQFGNLLKLAQQALADAGHEDVDDLLAQARSLAEGEHGFWQRQSDGLAVFAAPGVFRTFRLPIDLPDEVAVGDQPRLRPLAALLSGTASFYVLALSSNQVRLFEGTGASIGELDLGEDTPLSADDVLSDHDHHKHVQHAPQSRGGDVANFHGHGGASDLSQQMDERFFRIVAAAVERVVGRTVEHPMVLATAEPNVSTYRSVSSHRSLLDDFVAGNPEHLSAEELHALAWPLVVAAHRHEGEALLERYGALIGTGRASAELGKITTAADEGRVDTLLLAPAGAADGQAEVIHDPVDAVITATLRHGGAIALASDLGPEPVRAVFRY